MKHQTIFDLSWSDAVAWRGDDIIIAPVVEKGARWRRLYLPVGEWFGWEREMHGNIQDDNTYFDVSDTIIGPCWITVDAPLEKLPIFIKLWHSCFWIEQWVTCYRYLLQVFSSTGYFPSKQIYLRLPTDLIPCVNSLIISDSCVAFVKLMLLWNISFSMVLQKTRLLSSAVFGFLWRGVAAAVSAKSRRGFISCFLKQDVRVF